ncbi:MAG TPA: aminotransferase class I/II-fold pyridoxal phosphate-dependent enzyme [Vicinamibacterales bacterium]|nr:aminotransferase class I/II-fold pyridoxal phosphate-dependent enzyme [Vicinamibacterales bacterium]
MPHLHGVDRRAFLKNAGLTAVAGAIAGGTPAAAAAASAALAPPTGKYDFDTVYNRVGTNSVKWDRQIAAYGKGSIAVGMGVADMDFRVAPAVTKALTDRMQHENWGYLDTPRPFVETVVAWNKRRYGLNVDPGSVVMATGVHPGLVSALQTFSPRGSKVLLLTPTYDGFYSDISFVGCKPEESLLRLVEGRYSIDFDDFERRISHDTNTFILCNPQNPTGNCWSAEDLTKLGEICLKRRVVVLADEIHCDFVTSGHKYTPFSSLPDKDIVNNSITFKAASKSFGLAAWKCGWYFSDNADYMARIKTNHRADLTTMGLIASQGAYTDGEEWLNQVVTYIEGNHEFVQKFIKDNIPLIKYVKPQGTYLAWLDVSALSARIGVKAMAEEANRRNASGAPATAESMMEQWFVKNAKVHMNRGSAYGRGGEGHMRMNIATSRKLVELALTNIADALRKT